MSATSKRQRVLFTHNPRTPTKRLPTINLIEATPSTPSSSTSSALAPRSDGGRSSVRVVPRNAKTPSRLPVPVSKRPTGAVRRAPAKVEAPSPPHRSPVAEESVQGGPQPPPAGAPVKPHKGSRKPLRLLQRAAEAKRKEASNTPEEPESPGFVEVGIGDTPPSGPSANPSANSSLSRLAPPPDDPDISEVFIVPRQKKRPELDFDWARGGASAPESKLTENNERPGSGKIPDKDKWWSTLNRRRKKEQENENMERGMSSIFPGISRADLVTIASFRSRLHSRASSTEPESDTQTTRSRSSTLTSALLLVLPKPHATLSTDKPGLPPTKSQESLRGPKAPKSRNGTASSVISASNESDAPSEGTVKNGSLALRAIRSVRSLASVWSKNGSIKERKEPKKRNGSVVSVASGFLSATEEHAAAHKRESNLNAKGLPMAPGTGRHTAARAGPSKGSATTDLARQSSDALSSEPSASRRVSVASILSTGRHIRFSTDSHTEGEVAKNADAYAGCIIINQDLEEDVTRTSRTSKSSTSIRWSEHVLEAEREKAKRKSREVMRRVSAPLSTFNQTQGEKLPNIEPKKRAPLAGLFDLHIPSPSPTQVEFSPVDERCELEYGKSSQRHESMPDVGSSQLPRRPSASNSIDPNVWIEGSIRSPILRPRTASEIFFDRIRPSRMFESDPHDSDSALPYLNATVSDLESLDGDLDPSHFTPDGTLFRLTRRGAIAYSSPLDGHSSDGSLRDSLRASTMTIKPSKETKTPAPESPIPSESQVDQHPDLMESDSIPDIFELEIPPPSPAPDSPVFSRLTAPPVRRPSAGLLKRVAVWPPPSKGPQEPETPVVTPTRSNSALEPKQRSAASEATPQLAALRIRPGIVSRAVNIFDTASDTGSISKRAPIRPLRLKRASIVSQEHSSAADSSGIPSPSDRTFGEPHSASGYLEEDNELTSQSGLLSRGISVRERVASIDRLAQIFNGLEHPRPRQRVSPEGKQDEAGFGSMSPELQEDELDCDVESVLGPDIPDDLRAELSSQASPSLRIEDLCSSLTERRSTGLLSPDLASSQVRGGEDLFASYASRPSFDFSAEMIRVGLDKHLLGDLKASFAELMDYADDETAHIRPKGSGSPRIDAYDAGQDLQAVLRSGPSRRVEASGSTRGLPNDLATLRLRVRVPVSGPILFANNPIRASTTSRTKLLAFTLLNLPSFGKPL
jgi:hypothetical protein